MVVCVCVCVCVRASVCISSYAANISCVIGLAMVKTALHDKCTGVHFGIFQLTSKVTLHALKKCNMSVIFSTLIPMLDYTHHEYVVSDHGHSTTCTCLH